MSQNTSSKRVPPPEPPLAFDPRAPEYTREHEQVLAAVAAAQDARQGEGARLEEVARACALPPDRARALLHDLSSVFRLVTQLEDRYAVKPRL